VVGSSAAVRGLTELRDLAEQNTLTIELLLHEADTNQAAPESGAEARWRHVGGPVKQGGGRGHTL